MRRVTSLTTPAFLASAVGTLSLQEQILSSCTCPIDSFFDSYFSSWSTSFGLPLEPLPGKQSFCDQPGLQADRSLVEASMVDPSQMARYLASVAPHSGDWLLALPIANCGLRLEDEAVRVAVGMRLGLTLCVPYRCRCGSDVDADTRCSTTSFGVLCLWYCHLWYSHWETCVVQLMNVEQCQAATDS